MKQWLAKIRLWEVALLLVAVSGVVVAGYLSYFIWSATQTQKTVGNKTVQLLDTANATLGQVSTTVSGIGSSVGAVQKDIHGTTQAVNKTLGLIPPITQKFGLVADNINTTLLDIHRPCQEHNTRDNPYFSPYFSEGSTMPCGLLADTNKALDTFRGTMGVVEVGGRHWDKNLSVLDIQETKLFNDFDTLAGTYNQTGVKLNRVTDNFGDMSQDAKTKFHEFLYPPKCVGLKCKIGKIITDVHTGSEFAEPSYWTYELLHTAGILK